MTAKQIEDIAYNGEELPEEATTVDLLLYMQLRYLYGTYKANIITAEQGSADKARCIKEYGVMKLRYDIYKQHMKIYNTTGTLFAEANKSDCERCKRFVSLLDGRDRNYVKTQEEIN